MLDKNFVKPIDNKRYDIDSAVAYIKKHPTDNIGMRLIPNEPVPMEHVIISKKEIDNGFKFINLPAWQYLSKDWELVVTDFDRKNKVNEVRDFMMEEVPEFELDSRFYNEEEMDIDDWFNRLHDWLFDEDVKYKIFMFLKENELLKNVKHF